MAATTYQRVVSEMVRDMRTNPDNYSSQYSQTATGVAEHYCLFINDTPQWLDDPEHFVWDAAYLALERMRGGDAKQ